MKFNEIQIENFGPVKEATLKLSDRGLLLIQGENRDNPAAVSNGAGKSTIVEGISWALYGKRAKDGSSDGMINRAAGKGTRVVVCLEDGEQTYEVARHRKHKTGKNRLTVTVTDAAGTRDLTKGTDKLTQEVVDQIVGAPHEVFAAAVYAGQEAMPDLPKMTDKELKTLIEEAAGISQLNRAYEIARVRLAEAKEATRTAELARDNAVVGRDNARQRLQDAKDTAETWVGERDARIMDLQASARTLIDTVRQLREELTKHRALELIQNERDRVQAKIDGLQGERDKSEQLEIEVGKASSRAATIKANATNAVAAVKRLKDDLADVESQIGEPCPTCKRAHDDSSLQATIDTLKEKIAHAETQARELIEAAREAAESVRDARESASAHRDDMTDASELFDAQKRISEELQARTDLERRIEDKKRQAQEKADAIKAEREKVNPHLETIETRKGELTARETRLKDRIAELAAAEEKMAVKASVVRVFGAKGVRAHILDTVTPYLNERTGHYLGSLTDGRVEATWQTLTATAKGELTEKFSIAVSSTEDGEDFAELSGGEKRRVRLACALALQDLVATRAAKPLGLWVGDEIDAALDSAGLERLMNVLEEKARERGTVLVISHSDMKDWCSQCITVTKEGGVSSVVESVI